MLTGAGLKRPRHRRLPRHRVRRQLLPREGVLVQVDGSHHRWLGDDGPQFTLLLAVDDATGIVHALFCEHENTRDYFLLMRGLIQRYGIPIALYTDRHSVFKNVPGSGHAGAPTQFSRGGTLKKCVNDQAVYPLSEQHGLGGPREEIHRPWRMDTLRTDPRQGLSGSTWRSGCEVRCRVLIQDLLEQEVTECAPRSAKVENSRYGARPGVGRWLAARPRII